MFVDSVISTHSISEQDLLQEKHTDKRNRNLLIQLSIPFEVDFWSFPKGVEKCTCTLF